ncbi:MAG: hypothetical protein MI717_04415 [Spirochaetales bacterium]|nr:hypothetical protein [Spirochaetales bacterium]
MRNKTSHREVFSLRISMLVFSLLLILSFGGCRRQKMAAAPELPPTPVLTSRAIWGVTNKPYLKVLRESDSAAEVQGLLRQGDLVRILSKVGASDGRWYWLEIEDPEQQLVGWVPDSALDVYDSKAQAATAQEAMLNPS